MAQFIGLNGAFPVSVTVYPGQSFHATSDGVATWWVEPTDGEDGLWDDAQGIGGLRAGATAPSFVLFRDGIYLQAFQGTGSEQDLYFTIQFSHSYAGGTIKPHVHWSHTYGGVDAGRVVWQMEYSCGAPTTAFPASTTVAASPIGVVGADQYRQILTGLGDITPSATCGASCVCIGRLKRDPAFATDDYPSNAFLEAFDWHFQRARHGTVAPNGPR